MSGPICTECARTARKRRIGALVFLRLSENPEENLDNSLLWATLPHETTEKGRKSQENGESRFRTDLAANGASKIRTQQLFDAVLDQWLVCFTKLSRSWPMRTKLGDQQ